MTEDLGMVMLICYGTREQLLEAAILECGQSKRTFERLVAEQKNPSLDTTLSELISKKEVQLEKFATELEVLKDENSPKKNEVWVSVSHDGRWIGEIIVDKSTLEEVTAETVLWEAYHLTGSTKNKYYKGICSKLGDKFTFNLDGEYYEYVSVFGDFARVNL